MASGNKPQEKEKEPTPEESKSPEGGLEPKQGVITPADTSGSGPRRLRALGFKGSYKGYVFNDDGESATPVPADVEAELRAQYPRLDIEEIQ
jgi:hypothetical protein